MKAILLTLLLLGVTQPVMATTDAWVTVDRLNRRTCPDVKCGIVGVLMFREKATIFEEKAGWARISKYYNAACWNGKSEYVESGNAVCSERNGIVDGRFAEWVSLQYLSTTRPDDPGIDATGVSELVSASDDYSRFKDVFAKAASDLIEAGRCTERDFREMGGWLKSFQQDGYLLYLLR